MEKISLDLRQVVLLKIHSARWCCGTGLQTAERVCNLCGDVHYGKLYGRRICL